MCEKLGGALGAKQTPAAVKRAGAFGKRIAGLPAIAPVSAYFAGWLAYQDARLSMIALL